MNPSKRLVVALAAAFGISAVCTYAFSRHMSHVSAAEHAHMRTYFAPTREIASGEVVHKGDLRVLYWPIVEPVDGALSKESDVVDRVALYPLAPGQPVLDRDLSVAGSGTGLAGKIPSGKRAIALKSDEVVGVAGFLNPGSHVDVLVTSKPAFGVDPVTATVLQDVEVAATGQQTEPNPNGKPVTSTVVTLLLDPMQAERALLASNQGSLQFALRNGADRYQSPSAPVSMSEIAPGHPAKQVMDISSNVTSNATSSVTHSAISSTTSIHAARHAKTQSATGIEVVYGSGSSSTAFRAPAFGPAASMPSTIAAAPAPTTGAMPQMRN